MTPKNLNSKPPPTPDEEWEAGALDREIDQLFHWDFYTAAEERSLDRMHEAHRREEARTRAIMTIKDRLQANGIWVKRTSKELFLHARDWREWAKTATDPDKVAKFKSLGNLAEMLARREHEREVEAKKAKRRNRPRRKRG